MSFLNLNQDNLFLLAALGNPEKDYSLTRHNAGFLFADSISDFYSFKPYKFSNKINGIITSGEIAGKRVVILKPQTFMNNSGTAVREAMRNFKIKLENLIVAHDDADINFASQRIKYGGSAAGHNGIKSIVSELGTQDFIRIRLGIGKPESEGALAEFVLQPFSNEEFQLIKTLCRPIWNEIIYKILSDGAERAMNLYNRRNH